MKKTTGKLLSLALAIVLLLSLGSSALAAGDDWADYQQYLCNFAAVGAPLPEDAESMAAVINGCATMDELLAAPELGVFFQILGALDYDAWVAAGKPAEGEPGAGGSGEASGDASGEASEEESAVPEQHPSGEASGSSAEPAPPAYGEMTGPAGANAVVSYQEGSVTYVSDGKEMTAAIGEGQTAYLSVDGVNVPLVPGNYDGTVVIDVVDPIFESSDYQSSDKDVNLSTELASVIYVTEDGVQEGQSVLGAASGEIGDTVIQDVVIRSEDVPALSGIRAGGSAVVEVVNADIELSGTGGNDFMGQGAALCATDGATLIVRDSTATVDGWVRGVTFAGGQARLEAYDSTFICDAGEYDPDGYAPGAGMSQPPKGLGVFGNTRLNNMVHNADEYFERCTFINRNWGCLGVDAVEEGTLTCVDCEINVTECGYGAYSIGACVDTFTNCTFNIHDGVVAFVAVNGTVILDGGTVANSDRYGVVTHQAMNLISNVKVLGAGTVINSAYTSLMVKGRSADLEIGDGAALNAYESGVIIQAQDNDDLGAGSANADAVVNVDIHDTALTGDIVMSMAPASGGTSVMAVVLNNASVDGAVTLADAELAIPDGNITIDNILDVGMVTNTYAMREDCALTVTLTNGAVWNVTETSYVTELNVDATSAVNGTVTAVDGGFLVSPAAASGEAS